MLRLLAGKVVSVTISLLVVSVVIFLILDLLPGDPAAILLGTAAQEDTLAALRQQMGLDLPLITRYLNWVGDVLRGDMGTSLIYHIPVSTLVAERFGVTLPLTFLAVVIAGIIGIGSGAIAAFYRNGLFDRLSRIFAHAGLAIPGFCLGLVLILTVSRHFSSLQPGGFPGWSAGFMPALYALLLPALALAASLASVLFRVSRSVMIDVIRADFVRTAFAKGVSRFRIMWRHALPNSLHPILTVLGLQISLLVAGTVLIESVFDLPGIGQLIINAMMQRDFVVIRALALLLAGGVIIINALIELVQLALDPRLRAR
ncbi:ABC transporter permease [Microvirga sp. W0021]|uniref:ABC transporter permease n=1 Tax=Hohaiivirga grylli TaxID=3133970 RepID=A0ABV0BGT5_9HYPH